jgi:predicted dehydrogenase
MKNTVIVRRRDLLALPVAATLAAQTSAEPLKLAIAGLVHGHVDGFLRNATKRSDVKIVGISDPDAALRSKYAAKYNLPESILFAGTAEMIDRAKPDAVSAFTNTYDHPSVVEICAAKKLPVMMEKPLAVSMDHAQRIKRAADSSGIPVIVNYETTWYPSHGAIWKLLHDQKAAGEIRRMVAMDGHQGPKEIGTPPEFFDWLSDPTRNGAGALFDFGCYGANLMTWMMDDRRPVAVMAMTKRIKPQIYARVDDDATILVDYPHAQGVIEASWNWPFSRKDFEVYGERGYAIATGGTNLRVRLPRGTEETRTPDPLPDDEHDSVAYLISVARGRRKPSGLSSLANNMIVAEILTAARESARTGRRVELARQ